MQMNLYLVMYVFMQLLFGYYFFSVSYMDVYDVCKLYDYYVLYLYYEYILYNINYKLYWSNNQEGYFIFNFLLI